VRRRLKLKFKTKKCRYRACQKEFVPNTEWQKYCSAPCRYTVVNRRNAALIRKAKLAAIKQAQVEQNRLSADEQVAQ